MTELVIYKAKNGNISIDVNLTDETVWLSVNQMATLFGRERSVILKHLRNIFKNKELSRDRTEANFASVQKEGKRDVKRDTEHYNLDVIISVGYRVNSIEGIRFRQWATSVLKDHLIRGYTTHQKRLAEVGVSELEQTIKLLHKTLVNHTMVTEIGAETIQLIIGYAKTWHLLLAYDENKLKLPSDGKPTKSILDSVSATKAIAELKSELATRNEASPLFGNDQNKGLESILLNVEQTFDGEPIYPSIQERAANLLYFIIKDHPFTDGNKRIACFMFLLYLKLQHVEIKLNDNGLVALALLIAESEPKQKDMMVRLVVNLLIDFDTK